MNKTILGITAGSILTIGLVSGATMFSGETVDAQVSYEKIDGKKGFYTQPVEIDIDALKAELEALRKTKQDLTASHEVNLKSFEDYKTEYLSKIASLNTQIDKIKSIIDEFKKIGVE